MKNIYFLLLVVFYTPLVWGQSTEKQPTITVKGEVTHPLNLSLADLANMRKWRFVLLYNLLKNRNYLFLFIPEMASARKR